MAYLLSKTIHTILLRTIYDEIGTPENQLGHDYKNAPPSEATHAIDPKYINRDTKAEVDTEDHLKQPMPQIQSTSDRDSKAKVDTEGSPRHPKTSQE